MFSVNCFKATGSGHEEAATSAPAWPQKNLFRGKIKHALSFAFFFCWIEDSFLIFFVCFLLFQITTGPGRVLESAEGAQGAPKDEEPKKKEEKNSLRGRLSVWLRGPDGDKPQTDRRLVAQAKIGVGHTRTHTHTKSQSKRQGHFRRFDGWRRILKLAAGFASRK